MKTNLLSAFRRAALVLAACALATATHAGTFSTAAWTNDASTGITAGQTSWAFHFGAATATTVNAVGVTGIASTNAAPYSRAEFDLAGLTSVFNADTNLVTGTGSAVVAHDFVYGGAPGTLTVKGLTVGSPYTVSFFSVGFEAAGGRQVTFASGTDSRLVDQDQFGDNNGIRVDYTFTATAATQIITLTPQVPGSTFHLYGLALRQGFTVTNVNDSGAGSLRQALTDAAALPGPDTITFAPALSGQTISLASQIIIDSDVTLDASSLPAGLTVDDGTATTYRLFTVNAGRTVAMRGFTLANGGGSGLGDAGAILNQGNLTLTRCTITGCRSTNDAGAILNTSSGTLALTQCTLSGNQTANAGGAIRSSGTLILTHCTVSNNTGGQGGGIHNSGPFTLAYSIIAGNSASGADKDILNTGASAVLTKVGASIVPVLVHSSGGTANGSGTILTGSPNLAALASNGGPTKTCALLSPSPAINAGTGSTATADQRGIIIPDTPDLGAFEFVGGLNVTATADSGPGSLRAAVANAALLPGADTITFASGFTGPITLTSGEIVIASDVTIDASNVPGGVMISGNNAHSIFTVSSGKNVALVGLTLTGGYGIFGGAIFNNGGALTLTQCTLSGNNATAYGGAIYNNNGTLTLTACTLSGNTALSFGGAILNGNSVTLTNCTLTDNQAGAGGGALSDDQGDETFVITHCTIAGNRSLTAGEAGGIAIYHNSTATLSHTILAGNTTNGTTLNYGTTSGTFLPLVSNGYNLSDDAPVGLTGTGDIISTAPRLAPLADNGGPTKTMALLPGSPALDAVPAGSIIAALTTDQRGFPRNRDGDAVAGALPDIGAYEAQVAPFSVGFNFVGGGPAGSTGILASGDVAGAFPQANWNNLTTDYDGANSGTYVNGPASIKDGGGNSFSPNLKLWWDAPNTYGKAAAGLTTPDLKLMGGYLDSDGSGNGSAATNLYSGTTAQPFFALGGLPAAATLYGYKVIVYTDIAATDGRISRYWLTSHRGQNPASVGGESTLTGSIFTRDTSDFSGAYTRATATTDTGTNTPGGNYVQFDGLTEPRGFIVRAEEGSLPVGTQGRAPINAVQIVRNEIIVVTTTQDENDPSGTLGAGLSLREALRDAPDGAGIVFDSALNGATLPLGSEIVLAKNVTIDASSLPAGVTISGGGTSRIFTVSNGKTVALQNLTLTGGNGVGNSSGSGGAIYNSNGTLTLTRCTLSGNSASFGGAIYNINGGTLTLTQCTLSGNSSTSPGGAIYNNSGSPLTLTQCTLSGNSAVIGGAIYGVGNSVLALTQCTLSGNSSTNDGGAIYNDSGTLALTHCTLSGNSAGEGGAIFNSRSTLTLAYSIVAGNTATVAADGADIYNYGQFLPSTVTRVGANLVRSLFNDGDFATDSGPDAINALPLLAPLAAYGGPTKTMALLPGSPARNAATNSTITSDQRGFPIVGGTPDIGAYEAGTFTNFNAWSWETLPASATLAQHAATFDFDGDGRSNLLEYASQTDGTVPNGGTPVAFTRNAAGTLATIVIPYRYSAPDLFYAIERNTALGGAWTTIATVNSATNGYTTLAGVAFAGNDATTITFTDTFIAGQPKVFYRLRVTQQ